MTSPSDLGQAGLSRERLEELAMMANGDLSIAVAGHEFRALLAAALRDADVRELDEWARISGRRWSSCDHGKPDVFSCVLVVSADSRDVYSGPGPALARRAAAEAIGGGK